MSVARKLRLAAYVGAGVGILFHLQTAVFRGGWDSFSQLVLFGSSLPYIACALIARLCPYPLMGVIPLVPALALDGLAYYSVFVDPQSSTAVLALLWAPIWNLILVVPIGSLIGWLLRGRVGAEAA